MERRGFLAALAAAFAGAAAWFAAPWKAEAGPDDPHPGVPVGALGHGDYFIYDRLHKGERTEWDDDGKMMLVHVEEMRSVLTHAPTGTAIGFDKQLDEQEKAFVLEHTSPPAVLTAAMRDWKEWEDETRFTA